ncbi:MAG: CRISPR-associated endonuclease Cas2 [Rhodospirillales bacterium RIFCSPLOWO2_12_FULL_58_28]|nr:MAG: CRISPR-associated endonuclease Cas2 [Rhodospirillales bacterium RIFCSPLOWO2_02_FULL_58_16]OHC79835.1 MAG: CRISPR-associated endonuclease Cas2 [Rhodospirillales bacterium RIFCSPLOWO2_12_FULL_58_28]
MWMLVMFDLPVTERAERKAATGFRNFLLDQGFNMAQFSVYYRLLSGKDAAASMEQKIQAGVPSRGSVHILTITDKQYETMRVFQGKRRGTPEKAYQLSLF